MNTERYREARKVRDKWVAVVSCLGPRDEMSALRDAINAADLALIEATISELLRQISGVGMPVLELYTMFDSGSAAAILATISEPTE